VSPAADFRLDVAVTGFGTVGQDAEGHHGAGLRLGQAAQHRGAEGSGIAHMMVRGRGQQHRVGPVANGVERGSRQGRRGIAADRLQQQGPVRQAEQAQLLGGDETVFLVADHDRRAQGQTVEALQGVLQQARVAEQGLQLLRMLLARHGPQAGAGAAAENHRNYSRIRHGNSGTARQGGGRSEWAAVLESQHFRIFGQAGTAADKDAHNGGYRMPRS
jgi:hypothetical protein